MGQSRNGQKRHCHGTTKRGTPCGAVPLKAGTVIDGTEVTGKWCRQHDQDLPDSARIGGAQPGAGRPRNPRAVEVLREKIEADIEMWLCPLVDALTAERGVVVGDGPMAHVEFFADHPTRLRAVKDAFDRAFGKPAQTHELHHSTEESQVDRAIMSLLEEMDRRDQAHANGNGKVTGVRTER
jgi:hypothetical protein